MVISNEIIDQLLKDYKTPEDLMGEGGILKQLTKALIERCLCAELTTFLQEEAADPLISEDIPKPKNRRNGYTKKTIKGEFGQAEISIPRDRNSEFEPIIVPKGQTRFNGFDDKILALYARGMTTRDIQDHLREMYQVELSPTLISNITEAVESERIAWQNRTLDAIYPIVFLDALIAKIRQDGRVINKAIYLALESIWLDTRSFWGYGC